MKFKEERMEKWDCQNQVCDFYSINGEPCKCEAEYDTGENVIDYCEEYQPYLD